MPRLTLFALLSSVEHDVRRVISLYLASHMQPEKLLSSAELEELHTRYARDNDGAPAPSSDDLLPYIDFADGWALLNRHRIDLPAHVAAHFRLVSSELDKLAPIRNRVAHSRPLEYDDLPAATDVVNKLLDADSALWTAVAATVDRLRRDPSYVLGLELPQYEDSVKHNLPTPDFDETGFLGRKTQVEAVKRLCLGPYPVVTVFGDGGVGKTALALKVAYQLLDTEGLPFDAIVWATSKTTALTVGDFVRIEGAISDSLGLIGSLAAELGGVDSPDPLEEVIEYMREFRLLLVIDNLETVLDQRMRDFLGSLPTGSKVLLTSRIAVGAYEQPVRLEPLDDGEAVALLRAVSTVRGVPDLSAMDQRRLTRYCHRMGNNPLWIKWFVSGVQAGRRPEELLSQPETFLDFAMTNVYEYLSADGRRILQVMQCLGGQHSQAQLAFFTDLEYDQLHQALLQLATTNMVDISRSPTGVTFESRYRVGNLTRTFLSKHHPVPKEEQIRLRKQKERLLAAGEELQARQRQNPYLGRSLDTTSSGNLVVARHLLAAQDAIRRDAFDDAEKEIAAACRLAPEWFEVHRVSAFVEINKGNLAAAQEKFEAALELAPDKAPVRWWYGLFLLDHMFDPAAAAKQFEYGLELDPDSVDLRLELVRARLYVEDFDGARTLMDEALHRSARVTPYRLGKLHDLDLQCYSRRAEHASQHGDQAAALRLLVGMKRAYDDCPATCIDKRITSRLGKAVVTTRRIEKYADDERVIEQARRLRTWLQSESRALPEAALPPSADGAKYEGVITSLVPERGFGFIRSDEGHEIFFHVSDVAGIDNLGEVEVGTPIEFEVQERKNGRLGAVAVRVQAPTSSSGYG